MSSFDELEQYLHSQIDEASNLVERHEAILKLKGFLIEKKKEMIKDVESYIKEKFGVSSTMTRRFLHLKEYGNQEFLNKFNAGSPITLLLRAAQQDKLLSCKVCGIVKSGDNFDYNGTTCTACQNTRKRKRKKRKSKAKVTTSTSLNGAPDLNVDTRSAAAKRMDTPRQLRKKEIAMNLILDLSYVIKNHVKKIEEVFEPLSQREKLFLLPSLLGIEHEISKRIMEFYTWKEEV